MLKPEVALAVFWIPTIIAVIWLLTPPVLITLAIREWWKAPKKGPRTTIIPITIMVAVLADWACFLLLCVRGFIGGFGTHFLSIRLPGWFFLFSIALIAAPFAGSIARAKVAFASFLVFALWAGSQMVA
jgi:hypothetical protein